jgi:hypothetical protein
MHRAFQLYWCEIRLDQRNVFAGLGIGASISHRIAVPL